MSVRGRYLCGLARQLSSGWSAPGPDTTRGSLGTSSGLNASAGCDLAALHHGRTSPADSLELFAEVDAPASLQGHVLSENTRDIMTGKVLVNEPRQADMTGTNQENKRDDALVTATSPVQGFDAGNKLATAS